MKKLLYLLLALIITLLISCGSVLRQEMQSGTMIAIGAKGYLPDEIKIFDDKVDGITMYWKAETPDGKKYKCSCNGSVGSQAHCVTINDKSQKSKKSKSNNI